MPWGDQVHQWVRRGLSGLLDSCTARDRVSMGQSVTWLQASSWGWLRHAQRPTIFGVWSYKTGPASLAVRGVGPHFCWAFCQCVQRWGLRESLA